MQSPCSVNFACDETGICLDTTRFDYFKLEQHLEFFRYIAGRCHE